MHSESLCCPGELQCLHNIWFIQTIYSNSILTVRRNFSEWKSKTNLTFLRFSGNRAPAAGSQWTGKSDNTCGLLWRFYWFQRRRKLSEHFATILWVETRFLLTSRRYSVLFSFRLTPTSLCPLERKNTTTKTISNLIHSIQSLESKRDDKRYYYTRPDMNPRQNFITNLITVISWNWTTFISRV